MRAVRRIGPDRWPLQRLQFGIELLHPRNRIFEIVHLDAEMIETRRASVAPRDMGHADIPVADRDGARGRERLLAGLHAEQRLVEARVHGVEIAGDGDVIDAGRHAFPFLQPQAARREPKPVRVRRQAGVI